MFTITIKIDKWEILKEGEPCHLSRVLKFKVFSRLATVKKYSLEWLYL